MVEEKEILKKLENWAEPINNQLQYDGFSLWYVYRQMFLTNNFPNRFFKYSLKNFENNRIKDKKIISYLSRKAIITNELIKRNIRKKFKKEKSNSQKILFYTQADKIKSDKIAKIGNLIEEVKKQNFAETFILSYE